MSYMKKYSKKSGGSRRRHRSAKKYSVGGTRRYKKYAAKKYSYAKSGGATSCGGLNPPCSSIEF